MLNSRENKKVHVDIKYSGKKFYERLLCQNNETDFKRLLW